MLVVLSLWLLLLLLLLLLLFGGVAGAHGRGAAHDGGP